MNDVIKNAVDCAFVNADAASRAKYEQIGERDACGFAWIVIKPARGKLVSYLKEQGIGRPHYGGGYEIWMPGRQPTQSVSVHEAGAHAFVKTIKDMLGSDINIYAGSRLD